MRTAIGNLHGLARRTCVSLATVTGVLALGWAAQPPAAAAAGARLDPAERAVVRTLNRIRANHGLAALRADGRLQRAADAHSLDMLRADFFAHHSSDGTPMLARVSRYKPASRLGETLGYTSLRGRRAGRLVVRGWMRSPSHRAAVLSQSFRRVGVARRRGSLGSTRLTVFTADFSSRR